MTTMADARELARINELATRGHLSSMALAVHASLLSEDFADFVSAAWHVLEPQTPMRWGWALEAITDHLVAITEGHITKLLINVPPGMMKSLLVNVMWPAWEWTDPKRRHLRYISTAHKQDLAVRDNLKCRRLITSRWYQERWPVVLTSDQNAKCLARGTQISMADGTLKNIENVREGDRVLSYDVENHRLVEDVVRHAWCNGAKPARRITLSDGTAITATLNHRFYSWDDWLYVEHAAVGAPYAVLKELPEQRRSDEISVDDAVLLALWLADGCKTQSSFAFMKRDKRIQAYVRDVAQRRGWVLRELGDDSFLLVSERGHNGVEADTPMGVLKRWLGAEHTGARSRLAEQNTRTIRVPNAIMRSSNLIVAAFLGAYLACDGTIVNKKNHGVGIGSMSERMIRDLALLAKRFGVRSRMDSGLASYKRDGIKVTTGVGWSLSIMGADEVPKLSVLMPFMFGKAERFAALLDYYAAAQRKRGGRNATIPPSALGTPGWVRHDSPLLERAAPEVRAKLAGGLDWRRIKKIEEVDEVETWHLETATTHLFFAEGLLSHNTKFENSDTGFREAMAFTSMTGSRGDRVLIDDPLSVDSGNSEADIEATERTFTEALPTRVNDEERSAVVMIMQRIHERDPSGIVLSRNLPYERLILPMEYDPKRPCKTSIGFKDPRKKSGELLFPERFSAKTVATLKATLGEYASAGQLQQLPTPRGGGMFKSKFLKLWPASAELPDLQFIVQSYDTAFTETTTNDPTACTVWAIFYHPTRNVNCALLVDAWDDHMNFPTLRQRAIVDWRNVYGGRRTKQGTDDPMHPPKRADAMLVENKGSGIDLINDLRRAGLPAQSYNPGRSDKVARAEAVLPMYELELFYVLESSKKGEAGQPVTWARPFTTELAKFGPGAARDDYVDTFTQAARLLRDMELLATPRIEVEEDETFDYHAEKKRRRNPYDGASAA